MADFLLKQVDPAKLTLAWDAVKEGLEHIRRKNSCAKFRDEQVYTAISQGHAELYSGYFDGEYVGFVILAESPEAFTLDRRLLIWCAYAARVRKSKKGRPILHPEWKRIHELTEQRIEGIAREKGIHREFKVSTRPWNRNQDDGWKHVETTWEKRI